LRDADFSGSAQNIQVPTMLISGTHDGSTPPALVEASANLIPGSQFELVEGVARREEFGNLPQQLADMCRRLIAHYALPQAQALTPWSDEGFVMLGDDGEPVTPAS
jgi:hypothetical protein